MEFGIGAKNLVVELAMPKHGVMEQRLPSS